MEGEEHPKKILYNHIRNLKNSNSRDKKTPIIGRPKVEYDRDEIDKLKSELKNQVKNDVNMIQQNNSTIIKNIPDINIEISGTRYCYNSNSNEIFISTGEENIEISFDQNNKRIIKKYQINNNLLNEEIELIRFD